MIARVVLSSNNISSGPRGVERVDECNGDFASTEIKTRTGIVQQESVEAALSRVVVEVQSEREMRASVLAR